MLDRIIPKLLQEYVASNDPVLRAEIVKVLQDYCEFPKFFERAVAALPEDDDGENKSLH